MDQYRKSWALRYLREAKAELEAAKKIPYMASSLLLEAIKKARNAIYYSLGEPAFVEIIVREALENTETIKDPIIKFLIDIEEIAQRLLQVEEIDEEKIMKQADSIVQLASDVVETVTGEKIEN